MGSKAETANLIAAVSPFKAATMNLQTFTTPSKAGKVEIQAVTTPFKAGTTSTPSKALPPSSWLGEMNKRSGLEGKGARSGLVTSETEMMDRSAFADVRKEFDKKLDKLENDLAEEKVARVKLEKEVESLKVIVTKLRLYDYKLILLIYLVDLTPRYS